MLSNNVIQSDFEVLGKVIIKNDLSGLSQKEKIDYVFSLCKSLGLNPMSRPFQLIEFKGGKESLYAAKDATEQLRFKHKVSIATLESNILEGGIYIVKAVAKLPCGRMDSSTGVLSIKGLYGDSLANAMMKCETKAKRRVTLSICGLGMLDESELETIEGYKKIDLSYGDSEITNVIEHKRYDDKTRELDLMKVKILFNGSSDINTLAKNFELMKRTYPKLLNEVVELKDKRKVELLDKKMEELSSPEVLEVSNESI